MKRLLALLFLAAWPAAAQIAVTSAPCKMTDGSCAGGTGGAGTPGGADTQVQINDGGAFYGNAGLTYQKASNALSGTGPWTLTPGADLVPFTARAYSSGTNHIAQFQDSSNGFLAGITHTGGFLSSTLTSGRVPIVGTSGLITDDSGLTYDAATDTLTVVGGLRGSVKAGTNAAADTVTHIGSLGTGNATSGTIVFQTGVPQASGATAHVPATALTLTNSGTAGTSAPQAQVAAGTAALPGLSFLTGTTTGLFFSSSKLKVSVSGTEVASIDGSGAITSERSATGAFKISSDTILTRGGAAATWQLGDVASATPVAQTFATQGSRGGTDTNVAGQPRYYRGSLGTGTADPGALVDTTGYPTTSGTTQHAESQRRYVSGHWTALTAGAATGFATLTYGASTSIGAELFVTIRAGDGTNRQGMSYRVAINSVRDAAGNTQSVVAVIGTPPVAAGSGTLTCTFDAAEGAGAATVRANCASSLTETFLDANFQTIANGPGLVIAPL